MTDDPDSPSLDPASAPSPISGTDLDLDIAIVARDPDWRAVHPRCEALCEAAARAACRQAGAALARLLAARDGELAVVLADDAFVRELNRGYRGKDAPTNVLAFAHSETRDDAPLMPDPDETQPLGDVVLARETVLREAAEQGKAPEDHLRHLVVHGVLHLLGYDHQSDAEATVMEAQEVAALAGLGVGDPYAAEPAPAPHREGGRP